MGGLKYRVWSSTKHGNGGSHEEAASYKAQPKGQNFVPFTWPSFFLAHYYTQRFYYHSFLFLKIGSVHCNTWREFISLPFCPYLSFCMHQHDACNKKGFDLIVLDTRYVPYICPLILYYWSLIDGLSFPLKAPLILIALRTHDISQISLRNQDSLKLKDTDYCWPVYMLMIGGPLPYNYGLYHSHSSWA